MDGQLRSHSMSVEVNLGGVTLSGLGAIRGAGGVHSWVSGGHGAVALDTLSSPWPLPPWHCSPAVRPHHCDLSTLLLRTLPLGSRLWAEPWNHEPNKPLTFKLWVSGFSLRKGKVAGTQSSINLQEMKLKPAGDRCLPSTLGAEAGRTEELSDGYS